MTKYEPRWGRIARYFVSGFLISWALDLVADFSRVEGLLATVCFMIAMVLTND